MRRPPPWTILFIVLALVGFIVGLWLRGHQLGIIPENNTGSFESVNPANPNADPIPKEQKGFCCMNAGSACVASRDPITCIRGGGHLFNIAQDTCDVICTSAPRQ